MSSHAQWREVQDFAALANRAKKRRLLWFHRPLWPHERSTHGHMCACGCNSGRAMKVDEAPHIDLLVDMVAGTRRLRRDVRDTAAFDALCAEAERVDCPIRCYPEQIPFLLDWDHAGHFLFGGSRGGKTTILAHKSFDACLLFGGHGATAVWVAPSMATTRRGVEALVQGKRTDRWVEPVIPAAVVRSFPKSERQPDQHICLVEGSRIALKYASKRDAANIVGDAFIFVALDEFCRIRHEGNYDALLDRCIDSGAKMGGSSTPVVGSWAKRRIYDFGHTLTEAQDIEAKGQDADIIHGQLTCFMNPWLGEAEIERRIRAGGGRNNPAVRRDIFGEWVGEGELVWTGLKVEPDDRGVCHLRAGPWRDADGWDLVNINRIAGAKFFSRTESALRYLAGLDYNKRPAHAVVGQVCVPRGVDQANRANWILFILDEIVKHVRSPADLARFIVREAGSYRRQDPDHYADLAIACDPSMAHDGGSGLKKGSETAVLQMTRYGLDVRPCHRAGPKLAPRAPSIEDTVSLVHHLMGTTVVANGQTYPRLLIHTERCPSLLEALQAQEANEKGMPRKKSNTVSDRISGPVDALRYLAWAVMGSEIRQDRTVQTLSL